MKNQNEPLFQLSSKQDLILSLISKELQATKFTWELEEIGFDLSFLDIDLGAIILTLLGFETKTHQLWTWYYETLNHFAEKVDLRNGCGNEEVVLVFYTELQKKLKMELSSAR